VAIQLPIGEEGEHQGIIDLITMKAYIFSGDMGEVVEEKEIPEELKEKAQEWRDKMIERVAELDDELLEVYLEGGKLLTNKLKGLFEKELLLEKFNQF